MEKTSVFSLISAMLRAFPIHKKYKDPDCPKVFVFWYQIIFIRLPSAQLFIFSTKFAAFTVISTHPGTKPLRNAFLTDLRFDQAQQ